MFCCHSTRLRFVSARIRTDNAINFRFSLSICWQKLVFRTITSDVSRSYQLSKLEPPSLSPEHDIYISTSTDPFFNLSLEDWLFRHSPPSSPLLLIYRDSPCVIIGRNQNPWTEINFNALRLARIPFIRRRSGGGTVYHDFGNTNFSLHLPRASFDRHATGKLILQAVRSLGVDAHHVSGSAYKIVSQRAYHHGTMLISSRLDHLGDMLRPEEKNIITKGISSIRSPVCNLEQYNANITHEGFASAVIERFREEYQIDTKCCMVEDLSGVRDIEYIRKGMAELSTWDWRFGQTPEFTQTLRRKFTWGDIIVAIRSRHGLILDCSLQSANTRNTSTTFEMLDQWVRSFYQDKRYGFLHETGQGADPTDGLHPLRCERNDVKAWLEDAVNCNFDGSY